MSGGGDIHGGGRLPILAAIALSLGTFLAMQAGAAQLAGWVFEYPLDDTYIHLAMAEQIASGGYGVNAGEYASAASSPLFPFLLAVAPGSEIQRLLPLAWNVVGLVLSAWLWALVLVESGVAARWPRAGLAAAALGPLALNLPGLAFAGMEHSLHAAASLAVAYGLIRYATGAGIGAALCLGVFFAPALRLEGLALSLLAGLVLIASRDFWRGAGLIALGAVPVVVFMGFLSAHGLAPLPNSAEAKMLDSGVGKLSPLAMLALNAATNISQNGGLGLLALTLLAFAAGAVTDKRVRLVALAAAAAGAAHLVFGQIGWLNRYEVYAVLAIAAIVLGIAGLTGKGWLAAAVGAVALALGLYYGGYFLRSSIANPRAIHLQQTQMARFVKDFARVPVAVNDLGRVAWRNPDYVLDLWGLASSEARALRLGDAPDGWAGPLAAARGVPLVMIYDHHLQGAHGAGWVKLGTLDLDVARGFLGGVSVAFHATSPDQAPALFAALQDFVPTLPDGVRFEFAEEKQ